jgi:hypothetical protein
MERRAFEEFMRKNAPSLTPERAAELQEFIKTAHKELEKLSVRAKDLEEKVETG